MNAKPLPPIAELFARYRAVIYRRCAQLLCEEEPAKDAVQEVFLRALTTGSSFRGDCSPLTWLYRVATTHCLQQLRNSRRRTAKLDELAAVPGSSAFAPDPESGLTLSRILDETEPSTRLMLFCRYVDGMTMEEVADVTGVSRKTVAKTLQRLAAGLRGSLAAEEAMP